MLRKRAGMSRLSHFQEVIKDTVALGTIGGMLE
jgi:hypothetical protein